MTQLAKFSSNKSEDWSLASHTCVNLDMMIHTYNSSAGEAEMVEFLELIGHPT